MNEYQVKTQYVLGDPLNWLRLMDKYRVTNLVAQFWLQIDFRELVGQDEVDLDLFCGTG